MKLLTQEIEKKLPKLYSQEKVSDPLCVVKYFTPDSNWTWYGIEYSPETRLFFGLVDGFDKELGYFSLDELENIHGPYGLPVERDLWFKPTKLSELR